MSERATGPVIDEEYDSEKGISYLSVEVYDGNGSMLTQFGLDRNASPSQIVDALKEGSILVLLDASRIYSAEEVLTYAGALAQAGRDLSGQKTHNF